jgi:hypothetical protein
LVRAACQAAHHRDFVALARGMFGRIDWVLAFVCKSGAANEQTSPERQKGPNEVSDFCEHRSPLSVYAIATPFAKHHAIARAYHVELQFAQRPVGPAVLEPGGHIA